MCCQNSISVILELGDRKREKKETKKLEGISGWTRAI